MVRYSEEFKFSIIKRMMPPNNESAASISRETGLSEQTLYQWKRKARAKGFAVPAGESEPEKWTTKDKFLIVVETAALIVLRKKAQAIWGDPEDELSVPQIACLL